MQRDTNANDGKLQKDVSSVDACKNRCNSDGCYAFDFDRNTNKCYLFMVSGVPTNRVGATKGIDHYTKTSNCKPDQTTPGLYLCYPDLFHLAPLPTMLR